MEFSPSWIQALPVLEQQLGLSVHVLREDRLHPRVSGNKLRKLHFNLKEAQAQGKGILTFGGAFSNHLLATAIACQDYGLASVGVVRGEAHEPLNPTLARACEAGMQLVYISREDYRRKDEPDFLIGLQKEFGGMYVVPEGGSNDLGVRGCESILGVHTQTYDFIACPVGTGATLSGLIRTAEAHQRVLGFSALKGAQYLEDEVVKYLGQSQPVCAWDLVHDYHFGGYAKVNATLIEFLNRMYKQHDLPLDPVYTGKMMFGVLDMVQSGDIPKGSKVLVVHTGGLQGINGMNLKLKKQGISISYDETA